jgi:hypothetical protein
MLGCRVPDRRLRQHADLWFARPNAGRGNLDEGRTKVGDAFVRFDAGLVEQRLRLCCMADRLEMPESIDNELNGSRFLRSCVHPSSDRATATASKSTEGPPASWKSASITEPSDIFAPPILGATITGRPPASEPSAMRMAIVRPSIDFGALGPSIMRSAGEGFMSLTGAADGEASGTSMSSPSATRLASAGSTFTRLTIIRVRTWAKLTLLSSKTRAEARCACSGSARERKNSRAWL